MGKYLIQAFFNRALVYSVVVNTMAQAVQEVQDGLEKGYQMYAEKASAQN